MSANREIEMKATADLDEVENGSGTGEKTLVTPPSGEPSGERRANTHGLEVRIVNH